MVLELFPHDSKSILDWFPRARTTANTPQPQDARPVELWGHAWITTALPRLKQTWRGDFGKFPVLKKYLDRKDVIRGNHRVAPLVLELRTRTCLASLVRDSARSRVSVFYLLSGLL